MYSLHDRARAVRGYRREHAHLPHHRRRHARLHRPGQGRPVVLVHGFTAPATAWVLTVDALLAAGHRVIAFDRRAHGESETPAHGQRMARHGRDLGELLEHLDLRDAVLVGASMGGNTLWAYVDQFGPSRLAGCRGRGPDPEDAQRRHVAARLLRLRHLQRRHLLRPGRAPARRRPHRGQVRRGRGPARRAPRRVPRLPREHCAGDARPAARPCAAGLARRRTPLPAAAAHARRAREPGVVVRARRGGGGRVRRRPRHGRRGRGPRDQHRPARRLQRACCSTSSPRSGPASDEARDHDSTATGRGRSRSSTGSAPTAPCGAGSPSGSSRPAATVTTVDLRGHGASDRSDDYGIDAFADDLVETLPTGLDLVVGHSLGGTVLERAVGRLAPAHALYLDPGFRLAPARPRAWQDGCSGRPLRSGWSSPGSPRSGAAAGSARAVRRGRRPARGRGVPVRQGDGDRRLPRDGPPPRAVAPRRPVDGAAVRRLTRRPARRDGRATGRARLGRTPAPRRRPRLLARGRRPHLAAVRDVLVGDD